MESRNEAQYRSDPGLDRNAFFSLLDHARRSDFFRMVLGIPSGIPDMVEAPRR